MTRYVNEEEPTEEDMEEAKLLCFKELEVIATHFTV
jgi:hypothetical protein